MNQGRIIGDPPRLLARSKSSMLTKSKCDGKAKINFGDRVKDAKKVVIQVDLAKNQDGKRLRDGKQGVVKGKKKKERGNNENGELKKKESN